MTKADKSKTTKKTQTLRGQKGMASKALESLKALALKSDLPDFKDGDKLVIKSKIKEGDKERLQAFEGVVVARNGRGINETFTVRKVSAGVGVERVFPLHSPAIASIEVKTEGYVRRAKLYYLRNLDGRAARIKDKNLRLLTSQGSTVDAEAATAE